MVDRVHTPDGLGMVQEVERRQGRTWINVAGRGFSGWYLSHEVTADIGDHNVVNLDELPDRDEGTILPWDPEPRDLFHNQLNIQPTSDLPSNLDDTPSIKGLRNYRPEDIFPGGRMASEAWDDYAPYDDDNSDLDGGHSDTLSQPGTIGDNSDIREKAGFAPDGNSHESAYNLFGRTASRRHLSSGTTDVTDLPDESDQIPGSDSDAYQQVPSQWKDKPPGLSDYGDNYDKKNPANYGGDTDVVYDSDEHMSNDAGPLSKNAFDIRHPFGGDLWNDPSAMPYDPNDEDLQKAWAKPHDPTAIRPGGNGPDDWFDPTPKKQAAGPEFDGEPGTFERTQDHVEAPGDNDPFFDEDFEVNAAPGDPRESSFHVATTGDGYVVTNDYGAPMSRFYSTESEAVHHARFAAYDAFLDRDPMARQAAWADVRKKALRLRKEGMVHVSYYEPKEIQAVVKGDNGTYDTAVSRKNAFGGGVTYYNCSCPWGQWAFKRQYTYVGRFCSHGLAAYHEMQSLDHKGARTHNEDMNPFLNPAGSTDLVNFTQHIGSAQDDGEYPASSNDWSPEYKAMVAAGHPGGDWRVEGSLRTADASMLDDNNSDFADGGDLSPHAAIPAQPGPLVPVGQDPSHTMNPADGEMQVFSDPAQPMGNNDDDAYGRSQDTGNPAGILNGLLGGGDPLDGVPVPHQRDGDVAMEGIEVAHGGMPDIGDVDGNGYANPADEGIDPTQMMGGMPQMGSPADGDIATMAQQFLAKTSAKNYSLREQEELMHEKGSARQFGDLNTANSLYDEPRSFLDM